MTHPIIIAIDGPSASGKGTLARRLAAHLGFAYLDTGLLYRAVGLAVVRAGCDPADEKLAEQAALALAIGMSGKRGADVGSPSLTLSARGGREAFAAIDFPQLLEDEVLRGDEAGVAASKVAAIPGVRAALLKFQKDFCATPPDAKPGAVLDGRDIGTVIAPRAAVKIFVTASAEARAERRFKELQGRGQQVGYAAVLADMKERDTRDAQRSIAPTRPAPDAVTLDTTALDAGQALQEVIKIVSASIGSQVISH